MFVTTNNEVSKRFISWVKDDDDDDDGSTMEKGLIVRCGDLKAHSQ